MGKRGESGFSLHILLIKEECLNAWAGPELAFERADSILQITFDPKPNHRLFRSLQEGMIAFR
jgi:hypothetical protein